LIGFALSLIIIFIVYLVYNNFKSIKKNKEIEDRKIETIKLMDIEENDFSLEKEIENRDKYLQET
jgi:hypothetical protein